MSIPECPDLQIWNNAAFDNGDSEDTKENQSPAMEESPLSYKTPLPVKPINSNLKSVSKHGLAVNKPTIGDEEISSRDEEKIDSEIEEIEKEIRKLSSRLEVLKLEKAERNRRIRERNRRIVPAKFMEERKDLGSLKRVVQRRGVSLGPSEIISGIKSQKFNKPEMMMTMTMTPAERRKSCFWKLGDIDELKVTKERNGKKSMSLSPKSRKAISKFQTLTTVGSKKLVKKEDGPNSSVIQPKKLFRDGEKSAPPNSTKKPTKPGRVVASRYANGGNVYSAIRKRSLPENDKEEFKRSENKRASLVEKSRISQGMVESSRVKKKWDIPNEVVVYKSSSSEEGEEDRITQPLSISKIADAIPKIRTVRCVHETPRDSGAAKRVAALVGKKSYFEVDEEAGLSSVYQALSFAEGVEKE